MQCALRTLGGNIWGDTVSIRSDERIIALCDTFKKQELADADADKCGRKQGNCGRERGKFILCTATVFSCC